MADDVLRICRDEDCPSCGWPETFAEGLADIGPARVGCRKCGWTAPVLPHIVGYLCPSRPDGPLIPPSAFSDPCGGDKAVWSDGRMTDG